MSKSLAIALAIVTVLTVHINHSQAATCTYQAGSTSDSGDDYYYFNKWKCHQWKINKYWSEYGMEKKYWDDGMGYYDVCNRRKPLGRMMISLDALRIAAHPTYTYSILNWAYNYQAGAIKKLRVKCGDGSLNAKHKGAGFIDWLQGYNGNGTVYFYWPGIYGGKTVVRRSGIVLHEARHRHKGHNGGDNCPSGASCDSTWSYQGANMYHILWLWWFGYHGQNTTSAQKQDALRDARWRHDNRFVTNPGFNI